MRSSLDWMRFLLGSSVAALGPGSSLNCVWELTYRCNAHCTMCGYWRSPGDVDRELDTSGVKAGLARVAAHGCRFVNFSGGEPTLRRDLEEIVAEASSLGMWTSMVTNGSLLTRERVARLQASGLDSLMVSLDSTDPVVHDGQRGISGLHGRVLDCLSWLADDFVFGHRIGGFMTVISERNLADVAGLVELAERLGVYVLFQPEHARKTGTSAAVATISPSVVRTLLDLKKRSGRVLNSGDYLRGLELSGVTGPTGCRAGRKYFSVDPFGGLHPCVDRPAVGHVLTHDMAVVASADSLASVRSCPGCWYCFRGEADSTLSGHGCLERAALGFRLLAQNAERRRAAKRVLGRAPAA